MVADRARMIRSHGSKVRYYHEMLGYNLRMTDISAAIGLVQLGKLELMNRERKKTAAWYDSHIRCPGIVLPEVVPGGEHVYHQYVVRVTDESRLTRDELAIELRERGIGTAVHYPIPLHRQPVFEECARKSSCPVADRLASEVLSLPVHPLLTEEERRYISDTMNEVG
jgi:perosamine synthetase